MPLSIYTCGIQPQCQICQCAAQEPRCQAATANVQPHKSPRDYIPTSNKINQAVLDAAAV